MLGVAVLIVVISVMSGFDQEWRNRILGFNAHLKISQRDPNTGEGMPLSGFDYVREVVASNQNVIGVAPFVTGQVLLQTQPAEGEGNPKSLAPIIRGIDPEIGSGCQCVAQKHCDR